MGTCSRPNICIKNYWKSGLTIFRLCTSSELFSINWETMLQLNAYNNVLSNLNNNIGLIYEEKGRFHEAINSYIKALRYVSSSAGIFKNLGTAHHDLGLFDYAMVYCKKAIELDPGDQCASDLPSADMRIALGSLPKFFRSDLLNFPQQRAYLQPDNRKVALWRERYYNLGTGMKIGISWHGGSKPSEKLARSTALSQWSRLFSLANVHFINLQYGDCAHELKEVKEKTGVTIHNWEDSNPLEDLDAFAAQINALDLVISVDNSTVHMTGTLGIPVWTMLPYACDWRWMRKFEDTPWYKTVGLFRQSKPGNWNDVFDRIFSSLKLYIETGITPEITSSYNSLIKQEKNRI
jgi:tetratricopeptide (TPR) repeat protein